MHAHNATHEPLQVQDAFILFQELARDLFPCALGGLVGDKCPCPRRLNRLSLGQHKPRLGIRSLHHVAKTGEPAFQV